MLLFLFFPFDKKDSAKKLDNKTLEEFILAKE